MMSHVLVLSFLVSACGIRLGPSHTQHAYTSVENLRGQSVTMWQTGWSTLVQIPKVIDDEVKLLLRANIQPGAEGPCGPAYIRELMLSGSWLGTGNVFARAGSTESQAPFAVSVGDGPLELLSNVNGTNFVNNSICTIRGKLDVKEPESWGPDVNLLIDAGGVTMEVQQHTMGRFNESSAMFDLFISGLETSGSVGGWTGDDGAPEVPKNCVSMIQLPGHFNQASSVVRFLK